jgi:hypothetical protein
MVDVQVRVDALDDAGATLKSDTVLVSVIPAGESFNLGGELELMTAAEDLAIAVESMDELEGDYSLPRVAKAKFKRRESGGRTIVTTVTNTVNGTLSEYAGVYAVIRNASGRIIGGAGTFLPSELSPGESVRVEFLDARGVPGMASVDLSADNRKPAE